MANEMTEMRCVISELCKVTPLIQWFVLALANCFKVASFSCPQLLHMSEHKVSTQNMDFLDVSCQ